MIKYFDNEAEYAANLNNITESQLSVVGDNVKFDGRNVIVGAKSAVTGSAVVLDQNNTLHFMPPGTFDKNTFIGTTVGVVAVGVDDPDFRGKIIVVHKTNKLLKLCNIFTFVLTGYTLDGKEHSGVLSISEASNNYNTSVDYTVTYNASTISEMVEQLNSFFKSTDTFQTQDWVAEKNGENIELSFIASHQTQYYNTGKSGFTLTVDTIPSDVPIVKPQFLKYNGNFSSYGVIINYPRCLIYLKDDLNNINFNPSSDVTSVSSLTYPVCLPAYLGTSTYQADHCSFLRSIYGEGEEGWRKFLKEFFPVTPSVRGIPDPTYTDGKSPTYKIFNYKPATRVGQDGEVDEMYPALKFCAETEYKHVLLEKGCWFLPTMKDLISIMKNIKYMSVLSGVDKNADVINSTLSAMNASDIRGNSNIWTINRLFSLAMFVYASHGMSNNWNIQGVCISLPIVIIDV